MKGVFDTLVVRGRAVFKMFDAAETSTAGVPDGTLRLYEDGVNQRIQTFSRERGSWATFRPGGSAVLLVAAYDASDVAKQQADFVCDGAADDVEIEAARDALPSSGGVIQLSAGTFSIADRIDLNSADVHLRGVGRATTLQVAAGMGVTLDTVRLTAPRCGVSDLRIVGRAGASRNAVRVGSGGSDAIVERVYIDGPRLHGIGVSGESGNVTSRVALKQVYVTGAGNGESTGVGVVLSEYTADCSVDGLWATGCAESGLHTFNNDLGIADDPTRHRFSNIHAWSNTKHGISVEHCRDAVLNNFVVWNNTVDGVRAHLSDRIVFSNGVSSANTDDGFATDSGSDNVSVNNVIVSANGDNGFEVGSPNTLLTGCAAVEHSASSSRGFSFQAGASGSKMVASISQANDVNLFIASGALDLSVTACEFSGALTTEVTNNGTVIFSANIGVADTATDHTALANVTADQHHNQTHAVGGSDHTAGSWKVFYSGGTGEVIELALGASGTVLTSSGASSAPSFAAPEAIPAGVIVMWSGTLATIPSGWSLCDGTGGTPDLRSRFVKGAPASTNPGGTGGSSTTSLTISNLPAHDHGSVGSHSHSGSSGSGGSHSHTYTAPANAQNLALGAVNASIVSSPGSSTGSAGSHSHSVSVSSGGGHTHSSVGSGTAFNHEPAYYELAYIMKD